MKRHLLLALSVSLSLSLPVDIRKLPEGDTRLTAKIPPSGVIVLRVYGSCTCCSGTTM